MKAIKDNNTYKAYMKSTRKYYKYIITPYTQPTLTSNEGGSVKIYYKVNAGTIYDEPYTAFYPNTGTYRIYRDESQFIAHLSFKFNTPIKVSKMTFTVVSGPYSIGNFYNGYLFRANSIYGTDTQLAYVSSIAEGTDYTFDVSGNTEYSNYYTLQYRNGGSAYNDMVVLQNIRFYGDYRTTTEGTATDYSYYVDTKTFKGINA